MDNNESKINHIIANNLVRLLEQSNCTQLELAEHLGVTQAAISNWCTGVKMPRMDKIDGICAFFDVNRSELMSEPSSLATNAKISEEEQLLLDAYRKLDRDDQIEVRGFLKGLLMADKYKEGSYEEKVI